MARQHAAYQVDATSGGGLMTKALPNEAMTWPAMTMPAAEPCSRSELGAWMLRQRMMQPTAWHHAPVQSTLGQTTKYTDKERRGNPKACNDKGMHVVGVGKEKVWEQGAQHAAHR